MRSRGLAELQMQFAAHGRSLFAKALLVQPTFERRSDVRVLLLHDVTAFSRCCAKSSSIVGVARVFLMKPTKAINSPSWNAMMTLASRLLGSDERTSQRPLPSARQTGMPTGHPHWTLAMSRPRVRWSSRGNSFNQSLTGSAPDVERQNDNGIATSRTKQYHKRYVSTVYDG